MYGMPSDAAPTGFDTSMLLMSGYLLGGLAMLILGAMILGTHAAGILPDPVDRRSLRPHRPCDRLVPAKLVLIMFRGLRRTPLRTSLSYLGALFVLTLVLCLIYAVLHMIGNATREKESNFKAIVTHKTLIPSQMPPGYYTDFKQLLR